ncbi:proline-serine-threonine phosphatase-interacting protein 1 [Patella vulgata]|uniref:proline-serine-threonine phosphatase-interacting protein 1 n=1 Tax=Patella vulgata TaxID=6465 RepID=UPI00217FBC25|nr:proline-serine-threonine phosphatase-interacting protein 1 [Patella vulgata]
MNKMTSFNEAFWGTDYLSTSGFDTMVKRVLDGKSLCKDMEGYFKQRAKMEADYSKSLANISKSLKSRDNIGQLEASWNALRCETDVAMTIHADASKLFSQLAEETRKFIEEANSKRKPSEEKMKKCQQVKATNYNKMTSAKKLYNQRCKDSDIAKQNYSLLKTSVTITAKDLDKARNQAEKCAEQADKADQAYQESVKGLEDARIQWEQEMVTVCETFQAMEEERINFSRDVLWAATNVDSKIAVDIDECGERVRTKLESCHIKDDICAFIEKFRTGEARPMAIPYENYYGVVNESHYAQI